MAAVLQGEGQKPANGVVVLDDEDLRGVILDHAGWIITGTRKRNATSAHTFIDP